MARYASGDRLGFGVEPLHPAAPKAARRDNRLCPSAQKAELAMRDEFPSVGRRSETAVFFECPAKVFRICIPHIHRDGFDGSLSGHQLVAGGTHPLKNQVLVRRHSDVLAELCMQIRCAEAEARGQILHAERFGVVAVHVAHHARHERRNRPVLYAPLEFLQPETKLAPDQVAQHSVIEIGVVKCEENLLRKPQRLAHDRPLENARPNKPLRQPVQTVAHGHAGVVSIARRPTDG